MVVGRAEPHRKHQPAQKIIEHFVNVGDEWSNGRPQDDDVTFVVLKVKDHMESSY